MANKGNDHQPLATSDDYALLFEQHTVGQKVFEDLLQRFGRAPGKTSGLDRVFDQFQYAGRREILEFITLRINQANGVQDDEAEISLDG